MFSIEKPRSNKCRPRKSTIAIIERGAEMRPKVRSREQSRRHSCSRQAAGEELREVHRPVIGR